MRIQLRALTTLAVAVALTGAASPAFASPPDGIPPKTVGVLLQGPAPGDGGVPVGGMYAVSAYVSAGDQTTNTPTDRAVSLTFPAGVSVTALYRMVPGREPILVPVTGSTVSDTATAVPVTASAGWIANIVVDEGTAPGSTLTTTATSAGKPIGSTSVVAVPAGTAPCGPAAPATLCGAASTGGSPLSKVAITTVMTRIHWIPADLPPTHPGFLANVHPFGDGQIHLGSTDALPGAPVTVTQLDAYVRAYAAAHKATVKPGWFVAESVQWDRFYGANAAGNGVYAQSGEFLAQRLTTRIAIGAPVKAAPKPVVVTTDTPAAG